MAKMISECPVCGSTLKATVLHCEECGLDLKNDFELSPFARLKEEQINFLFVFLKQKGNMSAVQTVMNISYPTAKKRLNDLLVTLGLIENKDMEEIDMSAWMGQTNGKEASDIIRQKLIDCNGKAIVYTAQGLPCEIRAASDGVSFFSDKLPIKPPYRYEVFDRIVDLLIAQGGRARKGNGRNHKLGEPDCDETTIVGVIGYQYAHVETGKSVYDPVFVLAAVLEWAGIAHNGRGYVELTPEYKIIRGI